MLSNAVIDILSTLRVDGHVAEQTEAQRGKSVLVAGLIPEPSNSRLTLFSELGSHSQCTPTHFCFV